MSIQHLQASVYFRGQFGVLDIAVRNDSFTLSMNESLGGIVCRFVNGDGLRSAQALHPAGQIDYITEGRIALAFLPNQTGRGFPGGNAYSHLPGEPAFGDTLLHLDGRHNRQ